jgi:hypothetical protein
MNKKYLSVIVIVAVIIVIAVVGISTHINTAKAPVAENGSSSTTVIATSTPIQMTVSSTNTGSSTVSVSITPGKTYANESFSFTYPEAWSVSTVSPFSLTNFGGDYLGGGIIPPGGALIDVVTTTVYGQGVLQGIMTTQLMNAMDLSTTTLSVDGIACPAAAFQAAYAPGYASKDVSVYCQRGDDLWEMYLSYGASDTAMAAHVADFNSVLASMKLLQ